MKYKSYIIVLLILIGLTIFGITHTTSQSQPKRYVVKLYSGSNMIATWEALDYGKIDGESLEFHFGDRKYPSRVRISGTYSVEEFDQ